MKKHASQNGNALCGRAANVFTPGTAEEWLKAARKTPGDYCAICADKLRDKVRAEAARKAVAEAKRSSVHLQPGDVVFSAAEVAQLRMLYDYLSTGFVGQGEALRMLGRKVAV